LGISIWKAPIADQKKWRCLVRSDGAELETEEKGTWYKAYPKPMFDFSERREICLRGMKDEYNVGLRGNDPQVRDGTWRKLFDADAEGPTKGKKGFIGAMLDDNDVEVSRVTQMDMNMREIWGFRSRRARKGGIRDRLALERGRLF
jgi:cryptochrome